MKEQKNKKDSALSEDPIEPNRFKVKKHRVDPSKPLENSRENNEILIYIKKQNSVSQNQKNSVDEKNRKTPNDQRNYVDVKSRK